MIPENKKRLIIVSAPSGAGKTTIVKYLLTCNLGLAFSVSATTRAIRPGEVHGRDYFFIPEAEFKKHIEAGQLLEWEEVYKGTFYGTLKSEVDRMLSNGFNVIFDVDVVGGLNIKKAFGENALSIFVSPPSVADLEARLKAGILIRKKPSEKELIKPDGRWNLHLSLTIFW